MKIVQVSSYYPPHLGGQENVVKDLATHVAAAGHDVQVLTSTRGGAPAGISHESGVKVRRMHGKEFGHAPIMPAFALALYRAACSRTVVHIHIGQAFTPELVWLVSKLRRFRYVAELHIDFEPSGPAGFLLPLYKRFVLGRVLRAAAAVVVLNQRTLDIVRKKYGVRGKALVMNNGIDEAYFALRRKPHAAKPPKTLRLLFVGRLSKQKNLPMLLEALTRTKRTVHLDVIGDGSERQAIEEYIVRHKLRTVTLHGRLSRDAVIPFYEQCDVLVMPSLYEAQPLVLLEAMAARIPIIGTNVIGVAEHIWGNGIVVQPTAQALAEGFDTWYAEYDNLPMLVARGYEKAEKLRWTHLRKEYEALYQEGLTG